MKRLFLFGSLRLFLSLIFCAATASSGSDGGISSWISDLKGENSGHTVAQFLTLPVSGSELGSASASFGGQFDASDAYSYTANTALFNRKKFTATHLEWLMGLRKEFIAGCFPLEDIGVVGFYTQVFTPGSFDNAYTIDETPSHPSMIDLSAGVTYARSFFDKALCAGAALSYVESRLDNIGGRTAFASIDIALSPSPFWTAHIRAGNMGPNLSYTRNVSEPLPAQTGASISIKPLAMEEELSATIDPLINLGVKKMADEPVTAGLSLQAALFKFVTLRTGYEYPLNTDRPSTTGLCAGVSLDRSNFGADFGWKALSRDLGNVWSISTRTQLKEMKVKTAEDYFTLAQNFYSEGRLRQSLSNAKKAVALDPNMWKAHVLISTINALQRRESGTEMALIYTGNVSGQFLPQTPEEGSTVGGLARQASVISRLREQYPLCAVIDAGNFVTPTSLPIKALLADWYFRQCGYDALALGKNEFDFGIGKLFAKDNPLTNEYCCTNGTGLPGGKIVRSKTVLVKGYSLFIMSVVGPTQPQRPQDRALLTQVLGEVNELLAKNAAKNATLRVLIIHDAWERISALARGIPEIDVLLCGGLRQKFETPMKIGNAKAISPGESGRVVGVLTLRFNNRKHLESVDNHCITLTDDIPSDPVIAAKLRSAIESGAMPPEKAMETSTVKRQAKDAFAFISNRNGAPGIFLKMLDNHAEFPLTHGTTECFKPEVSFPAGVCTYFERVSDSLCPALRIMDLTGAEKRNLPLVGCVSDVRFSPNGAWLYYSGKTDSSGFGIFRVKPEGGPSEPIVDWKKSSEKYFDLSASGASLVFSSSGNGKWQLFMTDSIGRRPICLTDGGDNISPRFSPTEERCAFLSNKTSFGGSYDLWMYTRATGKVEQISANEKVNDFCWLDDAKTIICSAGEPTPALKSVNVDLNTCIRLIGTDSLMAYSERTPRTLRFKGALKILYTREYNDGSRKIFWVNPDGSGDQRVVNSKGQDWLE